MCNYVYLLLSMGLGATLTGHLGNSTYQGGARSPDPAQLQASIHKILTQYVIYLVHSESVCACPFTATKDTLSLMNQYCAVCSTPITRCHCTAILSSTLCITLIVISVFCAW